MVKIAKHSRRAHLLIALLVVMAGASWTSTTRGCDSATIRCPEYSAKLRDPAMTGGPVPASLAILGLSLGRDHLTDVTRKLRGAVISRGDECGSDSICYQSADGKAIVTFEAWPDDGVLQSFSVMPAKALHARCKKSVLVGSDVATGIGLRLGMPANDVEQLLGAPSGQRPSELIYSYQTHRRMSEADIKYLEEHWSRNEILKDPFWHRWSTIEVGISGGKVKCFTISDTETW